MVEKRCGGFEAKENVIEISGRERPAVFGVAYMQSPYPCRIIGNSISGAMFGVLLKDQLSEGADSLADFSIVQDNVIVCPSLPEGSGSARPAAIDVAADGCTIAGNRIVYSNRFYVGVRISGSFCKASDNVVLCELKEIGISGPVAIQIGGAEREKPKPVLSGSIHHNALRGPQHGIVCADAANLVIERNVVEASGAGFAILESRVALSAISGNRIVGAHTAMLLNSGWRNRVSNNDCRSGWSGITLFQEAAPQIDGNCFEELEFWGVFALQTSVRLDLVSNRLVKCGTAMPDIAFAAGFSAVAGEANITGNEILDAGSGGGLNATSKADYGIFGDLVLDGRVLGNRIAYSNAPARNPQREDRALIMRGLLDPSPSGGLALGSAIQVLGNTFIGTGRTALVELLESLLNDQVFIRFERVSFDHNYCLHFHEEAAQPGQATVRLRGRRAIVTGNHIKAMAPTFPSLNFNGMQGPAMGNVTTGGFLNHPDFPAPGQ